MNEYLNKFDIQVINKGIAGNKVNNLLERFDNDFKEVNPDYIFILIGVNDTWHDYPNQKTTKQFEEEYELLINKIQEEINVPIILLEPFIIGYNEEIICMQSDLYDKISSIKKLANKYNLEYLSFKEEFEKTLTKDNYLEYTLEGIHLLDNGYKIMSDKLMIIK
jgi:lysophospholipase L1-like esterase